MILGAYRNPPYRLQYPTTRMAGPDRRVDGGGDDVVKDRDHEREEAGTGHGSWQRRQQQQRLQEQGQVGLSPKRKCQDFERENDNFGSESPRLRVAERLRDLRISPEGENVGIGLLHLSSEQGQRRGHGHSPRKRVKRNFGEDGGGGHGSNLDGVGSVKMPERERNRNEAILLPEMRDSSWIKAPTPTTADKDKNKDETTRSTIETKPLMNAHISPYASAIPQAARCAPHPLHPPDDSQTPAPPFSAAATTTLSTASALDPALPDPDTDPPTESPPLDRAALTWQEDEITGHDIDITAPDDDGEGINGIGFKPTPAMAEARSRRRKLQVSEWRAREAREAREKRLEKRRCAGPSGDGGGGDAVAAGQRMVRFAGES